MKNITVVLVALALVGFSIRKAYQNGVSAGYAKSKRHYEHVIGERIAYGIKGYQRVQQIREKSEFQRGWNQCQEQF